MILYSSRRAAGTHEGGFILIFTCVFILSFAMLGLGAVQWSGSDVELADKEKLSAQAFWIAEGGIQRAVEAKQSLQYAVINSSCTGWDTCSGGQVNGSITYGNYSAVFTNSMSVLTSTGSVLYKGTIIERKVRVTLGAPFFQNALFSDGVMTLKKDTILSGGIGTNSSSVDLGTPPSTVNGGTYLNDGRALPLVYPPPSLSALASSGALNGTQTLTSVSRKYSSVNFNTLTINGNVKIYVTGNITAGNGSKIIVNPGASLTIYTSGVVDLNNNNLELNRIGTPPQLILFSTYTGANGVTLKNNGISNYAIYAPATDVAINNNGTINGAVVGRTINVDNNNTFSFYSALSSLVDPTATSVASWQEQM